MIHDIIYIMSIYMEVEHNIEIGEASLYWKICEKLPGPQWILDPINRASYSYDTEQVSELRSEHEIDIIGVVTCLINYGKRPTIMMIIDT
jgi:hypothetical protein